MDLVAACKFEYKQSYEVNSVAYWNCSNIISYTVCQWPNTVYTVSINYVSLEPDTECTII